MADEVIKRDQNHVTVGAAVTGDSNQDITMLRVDTTTGYLLVKVSNGSGSGTASQIASRDQNHRTVCMAWDEVNEVLQEVATDSSGNLLVEFI